jgi:hypothetical protein
MEYAISSQNTRNIVSESLVILVADDIMFNMVGSSVITLCVYLRAVVCNCTLHVPEGCRL